MTNSSIYASDFKEKPFWWEAYAPEKLDLVDVPVEADVAIVGSGYAGMCCALELAKNNIQAVVFDAEQPGFGGSTRSGGLISGGGNVGRRYTTGSPEELERNKALKHEATDSFDLIQQLIREENIDCGWHKTGSFYGAWCRKHFEEMADKVREANETHPEAGAYLVRLEDQRAEIGSDFYRGGMATERAAHLHPSLYFKGVIEAARKRGVTICAEARVNKLRQPDSAGGAWAVETARGTVRVKDVVIATNGYTGDLTPGLKRRVVPMGSYMIGTEELPDDVAKSISPKNRAFADSRRVLSYYRMSPDGKRLLYGGRAKFGQTDALDTAPILYRFMTDRFPQLKDFKITHAWTGNVAFTIDEVPHMGSFQGLHYALGCNGSGVAMMSYLGTQTGRKIAGTANKPCAFDMPVMPTHPLYHGTPWFVPILGHYYKARDWYDRYFK